MEKAIAFFADRSRANKMSRMTSQEKSRQAALDNYYAAPNHCAACGKVITVPENVKVREIRIKKFCDRSCANTFNNQKRKRPPHAPRVRPPRPHAQKPSHCQACGCETYSRDGRRKYCETCVRFVRAPDGVWFPDVTKGALVSRRCNWQSARSSIRNHAYRVFARSGVPTACSVCGYAAHVEVAHRRPVNDFPDTATMREINHITNLVALCPNHHWEFDHGLLKLAVDPGASSPSVAGPGSEPGKPAL